MERMEAVAHTEHRNLYSTRDAGDHPIVLEGVSSPDVIPVRFARHQIGTASNVCTRSVS